MCLGVKSFALAIGEKFRILMGANECGGWGVFIAPNHFVAVSMGYC
jgi:hypothetical protein